MTNKTALDRLHAPIEKEIENVDADKFKVVSSWYALFCTVMDAPDYTDVQKLEKLKLLRKTLAEQIPEAEKQFQKEIAEGHGRQQV